MRIGSFLQPEEAFLLPSGGERVLLVDRERARLAGLGVEMAGRGAVLEHADQLAQAIISARSQSWRVVVFGPSLEPNAVALAGTVMRSMAMGAPLTVAILARENASSASLIAGAVDELFLEGLSSSRIADALGLAPVRHVASL
jgi:hypothetical protein